MLKKPICLTNLQPGSSQYFLVRTVIVNCQLALLEATGTQLAGVRVAVVVLRISSSVAP